MADDEVALPPWRCVKCGGKLEPRFHANERPERSITSTDELGRFGRGFCTWCDAMREGVRAATVAEATAYRKPPRQPKPKADVVPMFGEAEAPRGRLPK